MPNLLYALEDQSIAGGNARRHKPFVADVAIYGDHSLLYLVFSIHDQHRWIALGIAQHRLLGNEDGLGVDSFLHRRSNEHARKEHSLGIGKDDPQDDGARGGIHVTSRN